MYVCVVLYLVTQSCSTLCEPMDFRTPGFSVHGILQARMLEWVSMPSSRGIFPTRAQPRSPTLQVDYLPSVPPGKPPNTKMGSLSLLQGIFLSQELNQGLQHCRWISLPAELAGKPHMCMYVCVYIYIYICIYIYE